MFLLGFLVFTVLIFIPVGLCLWRASSIKRETQNPTEDYYRSQLDTLRKDHAAHRLDDGPYEAARYSVQRQLADVTSPAPEANLSMGRLHAIIGLSSVLLIPILALFLYNVNGFPLLPSQSADEKKPLPVPEQSTQTQLDRINAQLATLPKKDPSFADLHIRRGQLESQLGMVSETVDDWKAALAVSFTPELALQIAELETRNAGHVTPDALTLYHRALDASSLDAPWRVSVESRIASVEHDKDNHP